MALGVIWAEGRERALGEGGRLPWRLPEDMAAFKALTLGHTVAMGRVTWEGLPPRFRPLPGRRNIVLSRTPDAVDTEGVEVMTLEQFLHAVTPGSSHHGLPDALHSRPASPHAAEEAGTPASHLTPMASFLDYLPSDLVWVIGGAQIYSALLPYASWAAITSVDVSVPTADAFAPVLPAAFHMRAAIPATGWAISATGLPYRFRLYHNAHPRPLPASERGEE